MNKKFNNEMLDAFLSICYCDFLGKQKERVYCASVPRLCIHCKTLEELFLKDVLDVPKDYKPKTLRLKYKLNNEVLE